MNYDDYEPWPWPMSEWRHTNGNLYMVDLVANFNEGDDVERREKYPPTVVYSNVHNGNIYARRLDDWHRSMTKVADAS